MPISLAPLKYSQVRAETGGPVASVEVGQGALFGGRRCFNASARLRADLRPTRAVPLALYSDDDGSGTDASRSVACYKAISEAIERWAFHSISSSPEAHEFRFDLEPTTDGMAAFPGFGPSGARATAHAEAVERWAVLEWWRGNLAARSRPVPFNGASGLEILTPIRGCSVALIWTAGLECPGAAYGFAGATNFPAAADKALVELSRNQRVLKARAARPSSAVPEAGGERRLVWFSETQGHTAFLERAARSYEISEGRGGAPRLLVDREVRGPWSRYARVWRSLYEHADGHDDGRQFNVFMF